MHVCAKDTMFDPDRAGGMKTVDSDVKVSTSKRIRGSHLDNILPPCHDVTEETKGG